MNAIGKKDFSSGLCLLFLGLFLAFQSTKLSIWGESGPEAGFFPFAIAFIIIGASLLTVLRSFGSKQITDNDKIVEEQKKVRPSTFKASAYAILMLLYSISLATIGFLITSSLFLLLILKHVEKQSWKMTILIASASVLLSYLLFVYLLKVPLPKGSLGW